MNTQPAIVYGDTIDFSCFKTDIARTAAYFERHLLSTDKCIGITVANSYWHWVSTLAVLRLGLACASIPQPNVISKELSNNFDLWIGEEASSGGRLLSFSPSNISSLEVSTEAALDSTDEQPIFVFGKGARRIILTSGTTGIPKIISFTVEQFLGRAQTVIINQGIDANTRLLHLMGSDTIGGFSFPLATWLCGGCVMFGVPVPGSANSYRLPYKRCNLLLSAPDRLKQLLDTDKSIWPGRDQRRVIVGGSSLHATIRDEALLRACHQLFIMYGSTEAGGVAFGDAMLLDRHPGAVGFVVNQAQVQLVDSTDQPVPAGHTGILRCKTTLMAGRYEDQSNSSAFRDGWFYPGDQGVFFDDGLLAITGRVTDVLNFGGQKISALELEDRILKLNNVEDVCVTVVHNPQDQLAIAVVCSGDVDMNALRTEISKAMDVNLPFHLIGVASLQRNAMGKLPRNSIGEYVQKILKKYSTKKILH